MVIASKELAVLEGEVRAVAPVSTTAQALANWHQYQDLVRALLQPADFQTFNEGGKSGKFIKKSGWRRLATHYGFTSEMVDERLGHAHDERSCARVRFPEVFKGEKDCGCPIVFARYVVKVTAPNGREVVAIGLCSTGEKNRRFTRQDHDIATTAYTRAVSRAISDMIGAGEVSAEEARATGEASGLSVEERAAIRDAWAAAPAPKRDAALAAMRSWGLKGDSVGALFADLARNADDGAVGDLIAILKTERFDPDEVLPEPLPTQGGRS